MFDEATAVRAGGRPDEWSADVRHEMTIVNGHPNGGYLLALLGRAGLVALDEPGRRVVSATASYLAAPTVGPCTVVTDVQRRGRTASQVRATLVQDDRSTVDVQLLAADLVDREPDWGDEPPPAMPTLEECLAHAEAHPRPPITGDELPPLTKVVQATFDPATAGWMRGRPSGAGEMRAWLRFVDGRAWDPLALLLAVDAVPPATFDVVMTGWVPTLSLTAYVLGVPAPGPLRLRFRVGQIVDGRVDEVCDVWDSRDRLVARSTQLAAIRMP